MKKQDMQSYFCMILKVMDIANNHQCKDLEHESASLTDPVAFALFPLNFTRANPSMKLLLSVYQQHVKLITY